FQAAFCYDESGRRVEGMDRIVMRDALAFGIREVARDRRCRRVDPPVGGPEDQADTRAAPSQARALDRGTNLLDAHPCESRLPRVEARPTRRQGGEFACDEPDACFVVELERRLLGEG